MRAVRWVGAIGAVIYAAGFILVSSAPGGGDVEAADFEDFYVKDDKTAMVVIGLFALTIGALALLWFYSALSRGAMTVVAPITASAGERRRSV